METLEQRISKLTNEETIEAISYMGKWMHTQLHKKGEIKSQLADDIKTDQDAMEILMNIIPEPQIIDLSTANEGRKVELSRSILLLFANNNRYKSHLEEAINRPVLRLEPLTSIGLVSVVLFILSLELELEYEEKGGKTRKKFRAKFKPVQGTIAQLMKDLLQQQ